MGIRRQELAFLAECRAAGVSFAKTLTIGRQQMLVTTRELRTFLAQQSLMSQVEIDGIDATDRRWAFLDELLRLMGAEVVESIDITPRDEATVMADLNEPIPESMHSTFTAVFDGGSLEHIFNAPLALRSYMEALSPGGHLMIQTCGNGFFGHGFYQFSPEFFHRTLSPENGFQLETFTAMKDRARAARFEVGDPDEHGQRVELATRGRVILLVRAKKLRNQRLCQPLPLQSDVPAWRLPEEATHRTKFKHRALDKAQMLSPALAAFLVRGYNRLMLLPIVGHPRSFLNRASFKRVRR